VSVPAVLRSLLTAAGPSGYEQAPAAVFREACAAFAEVAQDTVGSTVARVPGSGDGPLLAIAGHIDEIGLIVHHIDRRRRAQEGPGAQAPARRHRREGR
jgi:endoglucanase